MAEGTKQYVHFSLLGRPESPHKNKKTICALMERNQAPFYMVLVLREGHPQLEPPPPTHTHTLPPHSHLLKVQKGWMNLKRFNPIYCVCGEPKIPSITFWIFSLFSQPCKILIQVFMVLKPDIICTFLIHYGSLQKMLSALFNFVWNTQESKGTIFLSAQARCFLLLKRFQKR